MQNKIIEILIGLTYRDNDEVKIAAILALGDYKVSVEQERAVERLMALCQESNKDIAISAIKSLSKLSEYFI